MIKFIKSNDDDNMKRTWCIVNYGSALQFYNSIINTGHFFGPFLVNLISSIILITTISRQKAKMHQKRTYKEILREQLQQNKHLVTAPIMLVILALPRLIISFVSKCLKSSSDVWLFLAGYFISFIPSILTSVVFILPSKFYKKEFRKTVTQFRMTLQRRLYLA
jgi:C4-dicarboxylate transporter